MVRPHHRTENRSHRNNAKRSRDLETIPLHEPGDDSPESPRACKTVRWEGGVEAQDEQDEDNDDEEAAITDKVCALDTNTLVPDVDTLDCIAYIHRSVWLRRVNCTSSPCSQGKIP